MTPAPFTIIKATDVLMTITQSAIANELQSLTDSGLERFSHLRVTAEKDIPVNTPVITWSGAGVASRGNITAISAEAKAGKTAFTGVLLAGAIGQAIDGFDEIEVKQNTTQLAVIHLDSEQSEDDQQHNIKTILARARRQSTPDYLLSYNIRQLGINEYRQITDDICRAASMEYGGVFLIVIDGGADYIKSVNDEEQATGIVEYFTHLSIKYDCPVIIVVHLNPNSTKERGHLGSQLQRKCYGLISIKKDGDTSIAEPKIMRRARLSELQPIHYTYCRTKGYHVQIGTPTKATNSTKIKMIEETISNVLTPLDSVQYMDLVRKLLGATACSEATAKRHISVAEANKWIAKGDDGRYRINRTGISVKRYHSVSG